MTKFIKKNKFLLLYACIIFFGLSYFASQFSDSFNQLFDDYNLITLDVTVQSIEVESDLSILVVFEEYPDVEYALIYDNCTLAVENGFLDKVNVGKKVVIRTFPKYTNNFDLIPIVAITVDDEVIIDEETGYNNFLKIFDFKK